jgi:hypothetical protein
MRNVQIVRDLVGALATRLLTGCGHPQMPSDCWRLGHNWARNRALVSAAMEGTLEVQPEALKDRLVYRVTTTGIDTLQARHRYCAVASEKRE